MAKLYEVHVMLICSWLSTISYVNSFEEWWVPYDVIGSHLGLSVSLECHTQVNKYANSWDSNRKIKNRRPFQYWTFGKKMILPSMDTGKYYYNYTEFVDKPDEYSTIMKLQIRNIQLQDLGIYECVSQPGVQGRTSQRIELFEIPVSNEIISPPTEIINRANDTNVLINVT